MKKLLQINPVVRENTSTGKIMRALGEQAIAAGWESWIAYSRARDGVPQHSSRLLPVGNWLDLGIHYLATRLFDAHGLASRRVTRQMIRRIRELDPDIIHIHNIHGYFLNYTLLFDFLKDRGKTVIWTVHDCWLFTGHCYYYDSAGCYRWKTGCHDCPQKHAFPTSWLVDRSRRNWKDKKNAFSTLPTLTLVPVSHWMEGELSRSFLRDVPRQVILNGIDLERFRPVPAPDLREKFGIHTPVFYLAVASIWVPEKGLGDLLEAVSSFTEDESLVVIGQLTKDLQFPDKVVTLSRTSDASMLAAFYTEATAFVNPTRQDNYPTVNLEAIACGTPVVTYRTGGSIESITPETGRIVEQGDITGLVRSLHDIKARGKASFSTKCRDYALAHFSKTDRFRDYLKLYEKSI